MSRNDFIMDVREVGLMYQSAESFEDLCKADAALSALEPYCGDRCIPCLDGLYGDVIGVAVVSGNCCERFTFNRYL